MTTLLPPPDAPPVPRVSIPYHRLGRTLAHRWWRPVLGTLLVLAGALAAVIGTLVVSLIAGALLDRPEDEFGMPVLGAEADLAGGLISLGLIIPVVLLAARWTQRRPPGTVSSVAGRLRWRWLGWCLLPAVPTLGLFFGVLLLVPEGGADLGAWVGWERFAIGMAVVAVLVPFQAAAEEYLCRGWLLQAVGAYTRSPWLAIVVQAVVFGLLHGYGTPWGMADLVFYGIVMGVVTVRTGGLEAAIVLHVLNNLVAFTAAAAAGMLDSEETATDAAALIAGIDMAMVAVFAAAVLWLAHRRGIQSRFSG